MYILTNIIEYISNLAIPFIIVMILLFGYKKKVKMYEAFTEGAKEGFNIAVRIIPYLVAIFMAISIFRFSGAMDIFKAVIAPVTSLIRMPGDVVPLALMRPLSGGGALGITSELITTFGPESLEGFMASIMQGSTDTTFYILAVYFGSVGIRNSRHAVGGGLIADAAGILMAVFMANLFL